MDDFLNAYIEAALWSSNDPDTEKPLNTDFCAEDLAPSTLAEMIADCDSFIVKAGHLIPAERSEEAGHDFWLTRNGHGCGFWDGDWGDELGNQLTEICETYGERNFYVHDGQIMLD